MPSDLISIAAVFFCAFLLLGVLGIELYTGFLKRRTKYNQILPETTLYRYVRNCHTIAQDGDDVTIHPRYRTDSKGHQTGWGTVLSRKKPFTFFYRGRTGTGTSYNFPREELDDSMQLVVIEGSDFQKFLHGKTIYTRLGGQSYRLTVRVHLPCHHSPGESQRRPFQVRRQPLVNLLGDHDAGILLA